MLSFLRKVTLVLAVAMILGVFSYIQVQDNKDSQSNVANAPQNQTAQQTEQNNQDNKGSVLGASTSAQEENLCKYKNTTDSLPRGDEKIQDVLCNH